MIWLLLGLALWLTLAVIVSVVEIRRQERGQGLYYHEVDVVAKVCRGWISTGRVDVDELEELGGRRVGTWRRMMG